MSDAAKPVGSTSLPVKSAADADFLVSAAPHLSAGKTTRGIMFEVVLAMLPMLAAAVYFFRLNAIVMVVAAVLGCLVAEAFANKLRGRSLKTLWDGSAIVTGVILAFSLPPLNHNGGLQAYMVFVGGVIAILLAKSVFGGLGNNLFNPAMVGRAFLMVCFPAAMGVWTEPGTLNRIGDPDVQGVTMATPLGLAKEVVSTDKAIAKAGDDQAAVEKLTAKREASQESTPELRDLFLGKVGGSLGETCALAALIGGLWLVIRGIADWRQPLALLVTVVLFAWIAHAISPDRFQGPLYHLTSGALIFGAFFIATDYVGAPVNPKGRLIFGAGVGLLIMVIRLFGAYPEGLMFAILIMNALTPVIERMTTPTPYGGHVAA